MHVTVTGKASVISADQTKAVAPFANVELVVIKVEPTNGEFSDQARSSHATLWRPA